MTSIAMDLGKRLNPGVGWGEAKQCGHQAAFPQQKFLGVLSASDVTPRFLDATKEEFESMSGTRSAWWLHVLKQRGRQGDGHLLHVDHQAHHFCRKPALFKLLNKCYELRFSFLTVGQGLQELSDLVNPAEA